MSQLAAAIRSKLRELGAGWVEGELQTVGRSGGHCYLTLADGQCVVEAMIWRQDLPRVGSVPAEGSLVQAHFTRVDFYGRGGRTRLMLDRLRLTGEGELLRRQAEVLARLRADGLCDPARRRPLPPFPRRVAVVCGRDSDAKADVERALRERFPPVHIVHRAALVQGTGAVDSIIDALAHLQAQHAVDVIVVARGGGSVADLSPFDDERLCRAIVACAVPVVTSIGHSKQRPNCDEVAAACADVPARAAEKVVPSARELLAGLDRAGERLQAVRVDLRRRDEALRRGLPDLGAHFFTRREALRLQGAALARAGRAAADHRARVEDAGRALERARAAAPTPEKLAVERLRLRAGADAFFRDRLEELHERARRLATSPLRARSPRELDACATRLGVGLRRRRADLEGWRRAFDRLERQRERAAGRGLEARRSDVARAGAPLRPAAGRALRRTSVEVAHLVLLVAAKDFRPRGWVLASDRLGRPLTSVAALSAGDPIGLRLADGAAAAVVSSVHAQPQETP